MRHLSRTTVLVGFSFFAGSCSSGPISVRELVSEGALEVVVDVNRAVYLPGRRIKYWVDITNRSRYTVELDGLAIELQARPKLAPDQISLREDWSYNWQARRPALGPGKKITVPIVPEKNIEFCLELLKPGDYEIVAVVNERYQGAPYSLRIERPDLEEGPRMSGESLRGLVPRRRPLPSRRGS